MGNPETRKYTMVLQYMKKKSFWRITPEVLGGEEYTKAADVYFICNYCLQNNHCFELRPKIPFHTPKLITRMIVRCWDARVSHRPTFDETEKLSTATDTTPLNYKTHPRTIYTKWTPYNRFKGIKEIAKGGFGTIYCVKWIDILKLGY
ncbi:hypothetical protein Glove_276g45 [Diversispora epigaea]|uniref:Protein kinase domain-containing protein n=1 Tax=Diversispora epigaea TaxID=1348612 RepID=A0A397IAU5_9GLOM|nr:hypothetical protein Glove_276g45 [Diversispora epigaea]